MRWVGAPTGPRNRSTQRINNFPGKSQSLFALVEADQREIHTEFADEAHVFAFYQCAGSLSGQTTRWVRLASGGKVSKTTHSVDIPARTVRTSSNIVRHALRPSFRQPRDWRVACVLEIIEQAPKVRISQLSKAVNMNSSGLRHLVKANLGFDLRSWRTEQQLQLARDLLADKRLTLKEIRWQCGLDDGSNFTRAFKKRFRTTPAKFRKVLHENRFYQ